VTRFSPFAHMPTEFTHLLLTRFNTAIGFDASVKRLNSDWLIARLALFEQYCLPSVTMQTGAKFHWLIFFDAASPAWFKEKIAQLAPLVQPIYFDGPITDEQLAQSVRETGLVSSPYLISTRLDNDDAISTTHLASVQAAFRQQHRQFLTFPFGLQSFRDHLYTVYWPSNPFLSLIEKVGGNGEFTTVFCAPHDRVSASHNLRKISLRCHWLQVLHGSNVANTLRGWPRVRSCTHPGFHVLWPDHPFTDSIEARVRFSAQSYFQRGSKWIARTAAERQIYSQSR
jgi:hypothetical protein